MQQVTIPERNFIQIKNIYGIIYSERTSQYHSSQPSHKLLIKLKLPVRLAFTLGWEDWKPFAVFFFFSLDYQSQMLSSAIRQYYPLPGTAGHTQNPFYQYHLTYLSPLLLEMPTNFSMPPASRKALAFSMFLVITSCRVQQTAVTVSSDMALLAALLLLFPPGSLWTRSRMAYLPLRKNKGKS